MTLVEMEATRITTNHHEAIMITVNYTIPADFSKSDISYHIGEMEYHKRCIAQAQAEIDNHSQKFRNHQQELLKMKVYHV